MDFEANFTAVVSLNYSIQACYGGSGQETKVVVYAPHDTMFGMARMMEQIVNGGPSIDVRVRPTVKEACEELGIAIEEAQKLIKDEAWSVQKSRPGELNQVI